MESFTTPSGLSMLLETGQKSKWHDISILTLENNCFNHNYEYKIGNFIFIFLLSFDPDRFWLKFTSTLGLRGY